MEVPSVGSVSEPSEESKPSDPNERDEPFLFRLLRSAIAPAVLKDGGQDAPLSARGRIIFWTTVTVLTVAIAILFVASLHR